MNGRTALAAAGLGAAWYWWENRTLSVSRYEVICPTLPAAFDGLRVLQLSDLHGAWFGAGQRRLRSGIRALRPDVILLTGDLLNSRAPRLAAAVALGRVCAAEAPTFFTSGNHEDRAPGPAAELRRQLAESGVTVLEDAACLLRRNGARIALLGLSDRTVRGGAPALRLGRLMRQAAGAATLVLSHRPELLGLYAAVGADLVFAGHAHGGQIRLPGIGPLFAPQQGIFPRLTQGVHCRGTTAMVVSRGLGPSQFPLRVGNRPELVLTVVKKPVQTADAVVE